MWYGYRGLPDVFKQAGRFSMLGDLWGWDGTQNIPGMMDAASRYYLNWVEPVHITSSGEYVIDQSCESSGNTVYLIDHRMAVPGEFLLIENRNKDCYYDSQLEHPTYSPTKDRVGAAIWHVHWPEDGSNLGKDLYNDDHQGIAWPGDGGSPKYPGRHSMIELLQSDGRYDIPKRKNRGDNKDLFKKSEYLDYHGAAGRSLG